MFLSEDSLTTFRNKPAPPQILLFQSTLQNPLQVIYIRTKRQITHSSTHPKSHWLRWTSNARSRWTSNGSRRWTSNAFLRWTTNATVQFRPPLSGVISGACGLPSLDVHRWTTNGSCRWTSNDLRRWTSNTSRRWTSNDCRLMKSVGRPTSVGFRRKMGDVSPREINCRPL